MESYSNDFTTALNGGITAGATSLVVDDATKAPATPFRLKIDGELVLVGAKAGTTFSSLTRGIEGTVAAAHADGAPVEHVLTARTLQAFAGGTAFPSSPVTGERFFRTDRGIEYFWDGTRWLSTTLYSDALSISESLRPFAATTDNFHHATAVSAGALWLVAFQVFFLVQAGGSALSASHKWTVSLRDLPGNADYSVISIASGASGAWRALEAAMNGLASAGQLGFYVNSAKTGTPGAILVMPRIQYRLVG